MDKRILIIMKKSNGAPNIFGKRLKELREARGLTQTSLGKIVGLSQRMVGHYENHSTYPPIKLIPQLAKALKVTSDELLGIKPFKDERLPKNLMRRFKHIENMPLRDQRTVYSLINALTAKRDAKK
jgi:transcriptional regulator with XRE-family HTH domain